MKNIKISFILNLLIVLFVMIGSFFRFTDINFMPGGPPIATSGVETFKFYTVDTNILMAIVSFIFMIYEIRLLKNKTNNIPNKIYILKFIATSAITLTFMVTAFFLAPQHGFYTMYNNHNLFYHLIVPLLAIITYIFYERYDNKYKYAILGIIPMFLYSIYYISMILINLDNGGLTYDYDFYGFLQGNIYNAFIVIPFVYLVSYVFATLLIWLNKKN